MRGSYTWSHYYGNFDQDNSGDDERRATSSSARRTSATAPAASSGTTSYGDLRGDRRHLFKIYGYHALPWNATAGAFVVAQSGQPWETWSYEPYLALTTSTSDTARYAEPAGSRHTAPHWQLDLNYTQNVRLGGRYNVQLVGDLFNVANARPATTSSRRSTTPRSARRGTSSTRGASSSRCGSSSDRDAPSPSSGRAAASAYRCPACEN